MNDLGSAAGNHHRVWNGAVQHTDPGSDTSPTPAPAATATPTRPATVKATAEFMPLLNAAYNEWKGNGSGGDTTGPQTFAPRRAAVTRNRTATLYYRVTDDRSTTCSVTIKVKRLSGRVVKTLRLGLKGCDTLRHAHFTCRLAKGTYRFFVYARDLSGNAQTHAGSNRLTVR